MTFGYRLAFGLISLVAVRATFLTLGLKKISALRFGARQAMVASLGAPVQLMSGNFSPLA